MSSNSQIKSRLKKAKDALQSKQYERSLEILESILALDTENTTALLLKAVGMQHLSHWEASETVLKKLLQSQPNLVQAWQGLEKIYEAIQNKEQLIIVLEKLRVIFESLNECQRYTDTLKKLIRVYSDLCKDESVIEVWKLYLPDAPFYSLIAEPPSPRYVWKQICERQAQWDQRRIQAIAPKSRRLVLDTVETEGKDTILREILLTSSLSSYYRSWMEWEPSATIFNAYLTEMLKKCSYLGMDDPHKRQMLEDVETWVSRAETENIDLGFTAYKSYLDTRNVDYTQARQLLPTLSHIQKALKKMKPFEELQDYVEALEQVFLSLSTTSDLPSLFLLQDRISAYGPFPLVIGCLSTAAILPANIPLLEQALPLAMRLVQDTENMFSVDLHNVCLALRRRHIELLLVRHQPEHALHWIKHEVWPPSLPVFQLRGEAYLQLGQYEKAEVEFLALGNDPWAMSCLAWCYFLETNYEQAYFLLNRVVQDEIPLTHISEHKYRLGRIHLLQQEWSKALTMLVHVVQAPHVSTSLSSQAFYYLGDLYAQKDDLARSLKCWKKALELDPSFEEVAERLSRYLLDQKDPQQALDVLEMVASQHPRSLWVQKRRAFLYLHIKKAELACSCFLAALRIEPEKDVTIYHGLAETYMALGKFGSALKTMQQASLFSQDALTLHLLAKSYLKMGQYEESKRYMLEAGFELLPNLVFAGELYLMYARACLSMGRYGSCAELLKEGLDVLDAPPCLDTNTCPEIPGQKGQPRMWLQLRKADLIYMYTFVPHQCHTDLCVMLKSARKWYLEGSRFLAAGYASFSLYCFTQEQQHLDWTLDAFRIALQETPGPDVWLALGRLYVSLDQPLLAQHCFVASLHGEQNDPSTWTHYGFACFIYHDALLAARCFRQAILIDTDHTYAWFGLALAEKELSKEHFEHVFTITPCLDPVGLTLYLRYRPEIDPADLVPIALQALAWNPHDASLWNRLGCYYELSGNLREACTAFQTSLKLLRNPRVVKNLARVLLSTDPHQAEVLYEKLNTLDIWHALSKSNPTPKFLEQCLSNIINERYVDEGTTPADDQVMESGMGINDFAASSKSIDSQAKVAETLLMAQVYYRAGQYEAIPELLQNSPAALCAFGMVQGHEACIHAAFPRLPPTEAQYLTSVYHLLCGAPVQLALSALQRAVLMNPSDPRGWRRLTHFLGRYVPTLLTSLSLPFPETYSVQALGWLAQGDLRALSFAQKHVYVHPAQEQAWSLLQLVCPSRLLFPSITRTYSHLQASHMYLLKNDVSRALKHAQTAIKQSQPDVPGLCSLQLARVLSFLPRDEVSETTLVATYKQACATHSLAWLELLRLYVHLGWRPAARALVAFLVAPENAVQVSVGARVYQALLDPAAALPHLDDLHSPMLPVLRAIALKALGFPHRAAKIIKGMADDVPEWIQHILASSSSPL